MDACHWVGTVFAHVRERYIRVVTLPFNRGFRAEEASPGRI